MHLVRPGMWTGKLNIKNPYYSVPICEDNQSLWKFQYQTFLFKFTASTNGYTEWPGKFTKLMKPPLAFLRKIETILVAGYFDSLINMNSTHISCSDNISKITLLLSKLGFVIHATSAQCGKKDDSKVLVPAGKVFILFWVEDRVNYVLKLSHGIR